MRIPQFSPPFLILFAMGWILLPTPANAEQDNVCSGTFGDLNKSGTANAVDVQCSILATLATLVPDGEAPACLVGGFEKSNLNCDASTNVSDILLTIYAALETPLNTSLDKDENGCPDTCDALASACPCEEENNGPVCGGITCDLECPGGFVFTAEGCITCECVFETELCGDLPQVGKDCSGAECTETLGGACDPQTGITKMDYKECGGFCNGASWCDNPDCPEPQCYVPSALISLMNCGEEVEMCGNGICDPGETCMSCGADCGECPALETACCVCELEPQCCPSDPFEAVQWGPECNAAAEQCDSVPPVINCPATATITGDDNCVGIPPEVTATDNCSPQVGIRPVTEDMVGQGPHNIVYIATDAAGNEALCKTEVTVSGCPCNDCVPENQNIFARWPLDEINGNVFEDIVGNRDGISYGAPLPVTGVVAGARSFDGDDAIDVPYFLFPNPSGSFSVELWHYWEQANYFAGQSIFALPGVVWMMAFDGFGYHVHLGPDFDIYASYWHNVPKTWTHLAVTVDQGDGITPPVDGVKLYRDGQLLKSLTADRIFDLNASASPNHTLRIGGRFLSTSWNTGAIDDLTFYTGVLTGPEIEEIYNAGCSGKCYDAPPYTASDYGTAPPLCDPDTVDPSINSCGQTLIAKVCEFSDGAPALPPGFTVADNCDEEPEYTVTGPTLLEATQEKNNDDIVPLYPPNLYSYVVNATDASGNTFQCTIKAQLKEKKPKINCPASDTLYIDGNCAVAVPTPWVTDPCNEDYDLNISHTILQPGYTEVTYTVTSTNGQSASCTSDFQVISNAICAKD